jgi:putative Mg2+ transporter-C (MgtC) family protein
MNLIHMFFGYDFMTMTFRIIFAAILCGLIGFEREIKRHPAGFRTHLLVGVGSCIMMLLSLYGFDPYLEKYDTIRFDPARIPSYVISGIGFLGAGTILVKGATVRGLTTAASIWVVAGIGLISGIGMYAPAILTTIVVLLSLNFLNRFEMKMFKVSEEAHLEIIVKKDAHSLSRIIEVLQQNGVQIQQTGVEWMNNDQGQNVLKKYHLQVIPPKIENKVNLLDQLLDVEGVMKIN